MDAPLHCKDNPLLRFWAKVDIDPSGCWNWTAGQVPNGYGKFWIDNHTLIAHRWLYEKLVGPVPRDMTLDHVCRNRLCVNPGHLDIVTTRENVLRGIGITAVNKQKTHCKHGHIFDTHNTYVLSDGSRMCRTCAREKARIRLGINPEAYRV